MSNAFSERFDPDWIKRVNEWAAPFADEINIPKQIHRRRKHDAYNKTENCKKSKEKYYNSEKGKQANKRRNAGRHRRYREQFDKLGDVDKHRIREFYVNCPPGYHVDHIIPIAKGGAHHISNLQYLPAKENLKKGAKIRDNKPRFCTECQKEMVFLSDTTVYCEHCKKAFGVTYPPSN